MDKINDCSQVADSYKHGWKMVTHVCPLEGVRAPILSPDAGDGVSSPPQGSKTGLQEEGTRQWEGSDLGQDIYGGNAPL